ncbi:receptor-like serine/threonine-protein kinase SD1-8 isoform X2 [Cornus florida]|uniref:receptor-like serine/threonine-protein kinase SD1-8 isoform X2 n=1 Tax=Cornus florida TaxID=4283 RepID=UPI00289A03A1|nr:receptor-like serine/threonine-protein kinase SD1-8 isoform X2 [Cornus florida]
MKNTSITMRLHCYIVLCFLGSHSLFPIFAAAFDTITATQPLTQDQTIVSSDQRFELGFFTRGNSWYVGIWYKNIPDTVVWVANRDNPLKDSSGAFRIGDDGNLVLADSSSNSIWSSNQSTTTSNTIAQLLDSGNLVLRVENDVNPENYIWQSFDHPTDTLLPGMKLGWDSKTGLNRYLTSWKSNDNPSSGDYTFKLDLDGFPEVFLSNKQKRTYRSGPWNGIRFSGVPEMTPIYNITFDFVMSKNAVYYSFEIHDSPLISRLLVNHSGLLQRYTWIDDDKQWNLFWYAPKDQCDIYKECGPYGICDTNSSPVCKCMTGFEPKNAQAWELRYGLDGCTRKSKLNCNDDGFLTMRHMKLPDSSNPFLDEGMSLADCERMCRTNCSCTAYANANITGGGFGCVIWTTDLLDIRQYAMAEGGQDLYVKLAASDLGKSNGSGNSSNKTKRNAMVAGITVGICVLLFGLASCFIWKRRSLQRAVNGRHMKVIPSRRDYSSEGTTEELELPLLDIGTIVMATNNFSDANKLGEGGFGCVYMGMVEGQIIAVKRLSRNSGQGIEEFKNEVRLIARLQHRNLVRLLGCCIEMEEKMLIYEYMENRSLDSILFNKERSSLLNWQRRFNIINGTARGLLYLHQDSRFRIIHRDLKASNILLDAEMNPKISDFGMARIFGGDQTEANTKRVVGTYGYMSPEYAMDGIFSVKSDIFSFGVLVLEIVSGMKNRGFYSTNNHLNLLGYAWRLWKEGKGIEIIDSSTGASCSPCEVLRCIQVGLLCVQERAEDRPTMSTVVLMLSSETTSMPQPKHPGFCIGRPIETDSSSSKQHESCTVNQVTVTTMIDGR